MPGVYSGQLLMKKRCHLLAKVTVLPPTIIDNAGGNARYAYADYFENHIASDYTRRAYRHAVHRFLNWCEAEGIELTRIPPGAVGHYIRTLTTTNGKSASKPTQKLALAAIRKFFDAMVQRHAVVLNPASTVRGPKLKYDKGKTPVAETHDATDLLKSIEPRDQRDILSLRDRAVLAVLMYAACRVGAVSKLRLRDYHANERQSYLRLDEKGGRQREIPCHRKLQPILKAYVTAAKLSDPDAPLFRAARGRTPQLSERPFQAKDIHRMLKRRLKAANLPSILTCHSFRATTATDLLEQGVSLEEVQELLGHADPRTTRLYDRRDRTVTSNVVEKISI